MIEKRTARVVRRIRELEGLIKGFKRDTSPDGLFELNGLRQELALLAEENRADTYNRSPAWFQESYRQEFPDTYERLKEKGLVD